MKKVTGLFFIVTAVFLLGSSFKPLAEEVPRIVKIEVPIKKFAEEVPRIVKVETPAKKFAEEVPRIVQIDLDHEMPRLG